jgi:hypothetical protein
MLRKQALAVASVGVLVLASGAVSVAALSGVRILGFNKPSSASAVPVVSGGPASVLVVNKKHVVTKTGATGQPDTTVVVDDTVPVAPEVVDPGSAAPLVVRSAAAAPADGPALADDSTSSPSDTPPTDTPASPAAGSSGVSPARPTPVPSAATTPKPTTATTVRPAPVTTATTAAPAATTTPTTAAPTTTSTTAAPAATTTPAAPALVTSSGQVVPTSWQVSSSYLRSGEPIPPYPTSCRKGQLEDNGRWNCG